MENLSLLQSLHLFDAIGEEKLPRMLDCLGAKSRSFQKAEFIFLEGDRLDQIGVLLHGTVDMVKEDIWGNKTVLNRIRSGDVFGESFVCGGFNRTSVSFQAASECEALFLPLQKVMYACKNSCVFHHQLIQNMIKIVSLKNVQLLQKMEIISKKTIRERLLCWLSLQTQITGSRYLVSSMGRTELAEYLCVDRSALIREMAHMKHDGLIDFDKTTYRLKAAVP